MWIGQRGKSVRGASRARSGHHNEREGSLPFFLVPRPSSSSCTLPRSLFIGCIFAPFFASAFRCTFDVNLTHVMWGWLLSKSTVEPKRTLLSSASQLCYFLFQ